MVTQKQALNVYTKSIHNPKQNSPNGKMSNKLVLPMKWDNYLAIKINKPWIHCLMARGSGN